MLKLRLSMGGTKKRPVYKIVVADSRFPRDGRFIEKLGFFNPLLPKEKKERIGLQSDRIKYWLSQGAKPTMRVARLLGENQLMEMPAKGNNPLKAVPKKDRKKDTEEKTPKEGEKKADYADIAEQTESFKNITTGWLGFTDKNWATVIVPPQDISYQGRFTSKGNLYQNKMSHYRTIVSYISICHILIVSSSEQDTSRLGCLGFQATQLTSMS